MYVCGPTVNDLPHLGHGRFSLVWDVVRRWLTFNGLDVNYVSNITDIEDKIITRAALEGRPEHEVALQFEAEWWLAMDALGVKRPTTAPHATQYIDAMVNLIGQLLARNVAYETSDGVYFDVSSVSDYGCLAGQSLDALRATERVELNNEKRSPLDFAVWKKAKPNEPTWPAPFGDGRPGWHTECVVMSLDLLGDGFDLHTGGFDLRFPHHENERAQAVALGNQFCKRWSHNGWVMVGDVKMSKSLHNFTTLTELLQSTDQRAYRLLVLQSHYRSPLSVTPALLENATRALARLDALARRFELGALAGDELERSTSFRWSATSADLLASVSARLDDDLDTPGALALVFDAVSSANAAADGGDENAGRELANGINALLGALGLPLSSSGGADVDPASAELVRARDEARSLKDWTEADRLRDELVAAGWTVEDGVEGTVIRR
jgi:cysteinyl-tRNA synthetase